MWAWTATYNHLDLDQNASPIAALDFTTMRKLAGTITRRMDSIMFTKMTRTCL